MEPDFSGYATKAGIKCSDGRTIMPGAFKHQDTMQVPLVWQHGHSDPMNLLGHALLEDRDDGVYCYGFFNKSAKATAAREALEHGDINALSIWANDLMERSQRVLHGAIREVSLVLSGANPGALIENVTIRHSDGDSSELDNEAIIYGGTILEHAEPDDDDDDDEDTVEDVYKTLTDKQKQVLHYMVGEALESAKSDSVKQSSFDDNDDHMEGSDQMGKAVKHNVFESGGDDNPGAVLSHADVEGIVAEATKGGSLKAAVEGYALQHGIEDIDILFPEAKALANTPELFGRRVEWVSKVLGGVRKSPFSNIKTLSADITVQEARAKGYIKGHLKKEEFFKVARRVTTPTTIYKKQKLDRDDMVDITDFDVVAWLKGEMRLMLDEELARAILVGDGRAVDDEDKIDEDKIRPIATDHEVYTTKAYVNIDDVDSSVQEIMDAIMVNRQFLRGTGLPVMYTTETYITRFLMLRDTLGRDLYSSLDEVATKLRVSAIVPVEVLEEHDDIVAILVNPTDYVVGANKGGEVSMFDDFDIDYNAHKYLIETRVSGALTKLKSALVVFKTDADNELAEPVEPSFDGSAITITDTTGVVYRNADTDDAMTAAGSPYAVAEDTSVTVNAEPASGYYFASSNDDSWTFTNNG